MKLEELALSNPSKAFLTIQAAVKESGGWYFKGVDRWYYVVLSGPYTGTFELGPQTFLWHRGWKLPFSGGFQTQALRKTYEQRLWDKLGPLPALFGVTSLVDEVPVSEQEVWFELATLWKRSGLTLKDFIQDVHARHAKRRKPTGRPANGRRLSTLGPVRLRSEYLLKELDRFRWDFLRDETTPEDQRVLKAFEDKLNFAFARPEKLPKVDSPDWVWAISARWYVGDVHKRRPRGAMLLAYLLGQCAGLSAYEVTQRLAESPGRKKLFEEISNQEVRTFGEGIIPSRMTDRARFSKVLFRTWSVQQAQKALLTQVEGLLPTPSSNLPLTRYALAGVPSWKGKARSFTELKGEGLLLSLQEAASDARKAGVTAKEFRELWQTLPRQQFYNLLDVLEWLFQARGRPAFAEVYAILGESEHGRRVLQAYDERNFKFLLREHDFIDEVWQEARGRSVDSDAAEKFHALAATFAFPEGVTPLCTREDFKREGKEMDHCVAGYFWQTRSLCFSFKAPDGSRATLELAHPRTPRQFSGVKNSKPSQACYRLLRSFFMLNGGREVPNWKSE